MALVNRIGKSQQYAIPTSLTHSSGIITANFNGSAYSLTLSGLVANNLYFLYLRISGGTLGLFANTQVPSVYRNSFPEAVLVGAFYSNFTPAFGSFVTIEGVPTSQTWNAGLTDLRQGTTPITKGGTLQVDATFIRRVGNKAYIQWAYAKAGAGGSDPGGNWGFYTSIFPEDSTQITGISQEETINGVAQITTTGDGRNLHVFYNFNSMWSFRYTTPSNVVASNATHAMATNTFRFGGTWEYPVLAWSNVPLKDL